MSKDWGFKGIKEDASGSASQQKRGVFKVKELGNQRSLDVGCQGSSSGFFYNVVP
jgi:hypothetical protein